MAYIDIVFTGPPDHDAPRFVEVEDAAGASVARGEWLQRDDGWWVLRLPDAATLPRCSHCGHEDHEWLCRDCGAAVMP